MAARRHQGYSDDLLGDVEGIFMPAPMTRSLLFDFKCPAILYPSHCSLRGLDDKFTDGVGWSTNHSIGPAVVQLEFRPLDVKHLTTSVRRNKIGEQGVPPTLRDLAAFRGFLGAASHQSLDIQRLQLRIHQEWVIKLRHLAPALAENGQQPRRQRLMPFVRQAGHISNNQRKLLRGNVAW